MRVKPTNGNILIEPILSEDRTSGGLFLPEQSRGFLFYGTVIDKCDTVKCVNVGQTVAFKTKSAIDFEHEGKTHFMAVEDEIFGVKDEKLRMIGDHFLIKQTRSKKSPSGRILLVDETDADKELKMNTCQFGIVVALDGRRESCVKLGAWICMEDGMRSGFPITVDGEEYRVIRENDIMFEIKVTRD